MSSTVAAKIIALGAAGSIIIGNVNGNGTTLPIGSSGNVLTVVSGVPSWQPPAPMALASGTIWIGNVSNVPTSTAATAQGQVLVSGSTPFAVSFATLAATFVSVTADATNNIAATTVAAAITESAVKKAARYTFTTAPIATDDGVDTAGTGNKYKVGDIWVNSTTKGVYILSDATTSAAVWQRVDFGSLGSVFTYAGTVDASQTLAAQGITAPTKGQYYRVTVAGTLGGLFTSPALHVNDAIVYNGAAFDRIDNQDPNIVGTEFVSVTGNTTTGWSIGSSSFAALANNSVLFRSSSTAFGGIAPTAALQVLRQNAGNTALEFAVPTGNIVTVDQVTYAGSQVATGANVFTAFFSHTPVAGSIIVFFDGIRLTNADWSVSGTNLSITFGVGSPGVGFSLDPGDIIAAHYSYIG